jgi:nucleoid-associated protein
MNINSIIVHHLPKEREQPALDVHHADDPIDPKEPAASRLLQDVEEVFTNKFGKGYGRFANDTADTAAQEVSVEDSQEETTQPFNILLREYLEDEEKFYRFTVQASDNFQRIISPVKWATGGYLLFSDYVTSAKRYFLLAMLNDKEGTQIDSETLNIRSITHLDLSQLHLAARVDIGAWPDIAGDGADVDIRYLAFIQGRSGGDRVSKYFKDFLCCDDYTNSKTETGKLFAVIREYCERGEHLDLADRETWRPSLDDIDRCVDMVATFCAEKISNKEPFYLEDLSRHLNPSRPERFKVFANSQEKALSNIIHLDPRTVREHDLVRGKDAELSISFRRNIINRRVFYDQENDTLTIRRVPRGLRQELVNVLNPDSGVRERRAGM